LLIGVEGMTAAEAAVICGVTPETMRQRISRGRAMLTQRLDGTDASSVLGLSEVTT
jgi:DNA-directed RNA polymerase specialized sigma24 family protein